jgi:hypothetical protein
MNRGQLARWVEGYERAWRTPGTQPVRALFAAEATYRTAPFEEPYRGLEAIESFWEEGRDGPEEVFSMDTEIVAVDGDTGVVRVEVRYGEPLKRLYRDLWVLRFDRDGRCAEFEEWPFWPKELGGGWHGPTGGYGELPGGRPAS